MTISNETFRKILPTATHKTIRILWKELSPCQQKDLVQDLTLTDDEKTSLIPAIFNNIDIALLDFLIPDEYINDHYFFDKYLDAFVEEELEEFDDTYPVEYRYRLSQHIYTSYSPLIVYAMRKQRVDLIIYLLDRGVEIDNDTLLIMAKNDTIKLIIDRWDLNEENVLLILSVLEKIEHFQYIASKCVYLGYERNDYINMDYDFKSPIEKCIIQNKFLMIPELIDLGIPIIPDASNYFKDYKRIFETAPESIVDIFVKHGGDRSIIFPSRKFSSTPPSPKRSPSINNDHTLNVTTFNKDLNLYLEHQMKIILYYDILSDKLIAIGKLKDNQIVELQPLDIVFCNNIGIAIYEQ